MGGGGRESGRKASCQVYILPHPRDIPVGMSERLPLTLLFPSPGRGLPYESDGDARRLA